MRRFQAKPTHTIEVVRGFHLVIHHGTMSSEYGDIFDQARGDLAMLACAQDGDLAMIEDMDGVLVANFKMVGGRWVRHNA